MRIEIDSRRKSRKLAIAALVAAGFVLGGCNTAQVLTHGAVVTQDQIDLVPVGSSRDQVLLALGTPSTTGTLDEGEAFYYISQTRTRAAAFMKTRVVDRRVLSVYFDGEDRVSRIADYGLQDGKVFDFISRTTPTGGADASFIVGIIRGVTGGGRGAARSAAGTIFGD